MKVLVIEDDGLDFEIVCRALPAWSCTQAGTVAKGLELLGSEEFDWVLVDMGLPDSNGPDGVDRVHEVASCPVQAISGAPTFAVIAKDVGAIQRAAERAIDSLNEERGRG